MLSENINKLFVVIIPFIMSFVPGIAIYYFNRYLINRKVSYKDGDIYYNPVFGDLWLVDGSNFVKINDGYRISVDDPEFFIKVGCADVHLIKREEKEVKNEN